MSCTVNSRALAHTPDQNETEDKERDDCQGGDWTGGEMFS